MNRQNSLKNSAGFTLIEMIMVVAILGLIVVVGSNLFFSILRGSNKAKTLQLVKQNGNYAISVMERMIRNAKMIKGNCQAGMASLKIENPDNGETTFQFCPDPDFLIASQSGSLTCAQSRLTSSEVKLTTGSFDCIPGEAGAKPSVVTINFTLTQAGVAARLEEKASVDFKTTVSLRNY